MFALLAAVLLAASPNATPPAPGMPNFVQLSSIEGLPTDSLARGRFMASFRGMFAEESFRLEKPSARAGEWLPTVPLTNRFRLLEGYPAEDAWTAQIVLGLPRAKPIERRRPGSRPGGAPAPKEPPRASRGVTVVLAVVSPAAAAAGARPIPEHVGFVLPGKPTEPFPWDEAGATVARLVLERLHALNGDLDGERFDLGEVRRAPAGR